MSSGKIDKIDYCHLYKKKNLTDNFNITELVIPFSQLFKKCTSIDIYSGIEKIPFKERTPEYRMILRQEFLEL